MKIMVADTLPCLYETPKYLNFSKEDKDKKPQKLDVLIRNKRKTYHIAPASSIAYNNIQWGRIDKMFTPAYWKAQFLMRDVYPQYSMYKLGETIEEEIAACLLGGHGISADMGLCAYTKILQSGLLRHKQANDKQVYNEIYHILSTPMAIRKKPVKYRYPKQKSDYLFDALNKAWSSNIPDDDMEFRKWLMAMKGIGYKTGSWITRNWLNSDNVAIIDIHIFRAGILMGLFNGNENISKQYLFLEEQLLNIAEAMEVKMSQLDSIMWHQMRILNRHVIKAVDSRMASM